MDTEFDMKHLKTAKEYIGRNVTINKDKINSPNIVSNNKVIIIFLKVEEWTGQKKNGK